MVWYARDNFNSIDKRLAVTEEEILDVFRIVYNSGWLSHHLVEKGIFGDSK